MHRRRYELMLARVEVRDADSDSPKAGDNDHSPAADNDHSPAADNDHSPAADNDHSPAADNDHSPAADSDISRNDRATDGHALLAATSAERSRLLALRAAGTIGDHAFQRIEEELDWEELYLQRSNEGS